MIKKTFAWAKPFFIIFYFRFRAFSIQKNEKNEFTGGFLT